MFTDEVVAEIRSLMGEGSFVPFAIYNKSLDWIWVQVADCSVTEVYISSGFVMLERNHTENGQRTNIGFHIEGARMFCRENNLPMDGVVSIRGILDCMQKLDPKVRPAILDVTLPMLEEYELDQVSFT